MTNLLRANLCRLKRDKVFWLCVGVLLAGSAGMMLHWRREGLGVDMEPVKGLEYYYFRLTIILGLFQSVFACLFLNTEYAEGTVRNKLSIGHTRREIYLANFLTVLAASLLMALAWAVGSCAGIPYWGLWRFGPRGLALHMLVVLAFTAVYAAMFTFIGMLDAGRSAIVVSLLAWFAVTMAASQLDNGLSEPEFISGISMTVDGIQMASPEPNPKYLTGAVRAVYEFLMDLLPIGQAVQVQRLELTHPARALACDAVLTLGFTLGGLALFRKKDLK